MDANAVLDEWCNCSGEFSPEYYAHYGPNEASEAIREFFDTVVGPNGAVLELGCSSGRHLAHLHENGYRDLHGIDVNPNAFCVMEAAYPAVARAGTFHCDAIENVLIDYEDDEFDAVYSVETLQHVHPDNAWVFSEIARIAGTALVTSEIERENGATDDGDVTYVNDEFPLYYRDWSAAFAGVGFSEVGSAVVGRDTIRTFRASER